MVKTMFTLLAIVDALYALALIFATGPLLAFYGMSTDRTGTFLAQFLGATFVAIGWINWFSRDLPDSDARRTIVRADFIGTAIGFVLALSNQLQGVAGPTGWMIVGLTAVFAAAFAYLSYGSMSRAARAA